MAVIAFMSDLGERDHYVAAVKAVILSRKPEQPIVDISHQIEPNNILHGAYVLKNVFRSFPESTVFMVDIDPAIQSENRLIGLRMEGHYFLGHDSGIFSLLDAETPTEIVALTGVGGTFPGRQVLAPAALALAQGGSLKEQGSPLEAINRKVDRQVKANRREIAGQVIHIDHCGNLITNILKSDFDQIRSIIGKDKPFVIHFAGESLSRLHENYHEVGKGDCFVLFNNYGHLEIGMKFGRADRLMGLRLDSQVSINFQDT
jgi:hypothetical protein